MEVIEKRHATTEEGISLSRRIDPALRKRDQRPPPEVASRIISQALRVAESAAVRLTLS